MNKTHKELLVKFLDTARVGLAELIGNFLWAILGISFYVVIAQINQDDATQLVRDHLFDLIFLIVVASLVIEVCARSVDWVDNKFSKTERPVNEQI